MGFLKKCFYHLRIVMVRSRIPLQIWNTIRLGNWTVQRRWISLRIGIVGVPFAKGQIRSGVENAPQALRTAGLVKELLSLGHNIKDFGNVTCKAIGPEDPIPDTLTALPDLAACTEQLSLRVRQIMLERRAVLVVGGDHSVVLGSVDGHIQARGVDGSIALLWVDAHADINTASTSGTGNLHGMPVALLVEELVDYWPYLPGLDWQTPTMSIKNLAYIGLRDVDRYERLIIEKFGVTAFGMEDVERFGIEEVTKVALNKINPSGKYSLHVSFDIDALDPLEAPCTGTPVRGGLTLREALTVMEMAQRSETLGVVDIVEFNPTIGSKLQLRITLDAALQIIKAAFAFSRSGVVPKHVKTLPGKYPGEECIRVLSTLK